MDITKLVVDPHDEHETLHKLFFDARYPLKIQQWRCCYHLYAKSQTNALTDRDVQYYGFLSLYHFKRVYARVVIFNLSHTDYTFHEIVHWIRKRIRRLFPDTFIPENHYYFYDFLVNLPLYVLLSLGW